MRRLTTGLTIPYYGLLVLVLRSKRLLLLVQEQSLVLDTATWRIFILV